jgi:glyoxylase-like metal-dependent hydrolase (beta-lactamase superfamily II)
MMDTLWGAFEAVPQAQLSVLVGEEVLRFGELEFKAVYTPGHDIHHLAYVLEDGIFCGDVGGVRLQGSHHTIAPTPPPDINLAIWRESVEKLRQHNPKRLFPTHYGQHSDVALHFEKLEQSIVQLEQLSRAHFGRGGDTNSLAQAIQELANSQIQDKALEMKYALSFDSTFLAALVFDPVQIRPRHTSPEPPMLGSSSERRHQRNRYLFAR